MQATGVGQFKIADLFINVHEALFISVTVQFICCIII